MEFLRIGKTAFNFMKELYKKKMDIDPGNSEMLLGVTNPTRFVNELIEKYFDGKVIALSEANKKMIDEVIDQGLNKSAEEVVNQLLSEVEIEVQKEIPKTKIVLGKKVKTRIVQKKPNYVTGNN